MNVSLTAELKKFVQSQLNAGIYQTANEVVRAGLRRLKEDQLYRADTSRTLIQLENRLQQAVEAIDSGRGVDSHTVLSRLRRRIREARGET